MEEKNLTEIAGVGANAAALLTEAGFTTVADVANADETVLAKVKGFGPARAAKIIASAKSLVQAPADETAGTETEAAKSEKTRAEEIPVETPETDEAKEPEAEKTETEAVVASDGSNKAADLDAAPPYMAAAMKSDQPKPAGRGISKLAIAAGLTILLVAGAGFALKAGKLDSAVETLQAAISGDDDSSVSQTATVENGESKTATGTNETDGTEGGALAAASESTPVATETATVETSGEDTTSTESTTSETAVASSQSSASAAVDATAGKAATWSPAVPPYGMPFAHPYYARPHLWNNAYGTGQLAMNFSGGARSHGYGYGYPYPAYGYAPYPFPPAYLAQRSVSKQATER